MRTEALVVQALNATFELKAVDLEEPQPNGP